MKRRARLFLLLAALWAAGCAPRALVETPRVPLEVAPLAEALRAYNAAPKAIRGQGRLWVRGRGSAEFGTRAAEGAGFRLDAVTSVLSTPVLTLACRVGDECVAYFPSRNKAYRGRDEGWAGWFETLLRGRVPHVGSPSGAWAVPGGPSVLLLSGPNGWREEVEFDPTSGLPRRLVVLREGEQLAEVTLAEHVSVGGHPFPTRLTVRAEDPEAVYELEFRQVEQDLVPQEQMFTITLPEGAAVETIRGRAYWNETGLPFWLPTPGG